MQGKIFPCHQSQEIDKIACSEFWKAKDSYRQLQNAFYEHMKNNDFKLERGTPSDKEHISIEKYKEMTNYKNTKNLLNNINLELPKTPDIKDIKKILINRDEKIVNLLSINSSLGLLKNYLYNVKMKLFINLRMKLGVILI